VEATQQLAGVRHGRTSDIYTDLGKKVYDASGLTGSVEKSRQLYDLKWLRSPVDGLVQRVDVTTTGGVVTPAQSLVTIVPDGTPLIVEASLSNEDIGYVRAGQDVDVKVDTFPFQKYGTLKGKLIWISPDADEKSQGNDDSKGGASSGKSSPDPKSSKPSYVYKVHIRPDNTNFVVDGKTTPIQAGMTVQADITTDHRRIIEFFLSPVIKYLDEGLRVR
jgi:hemolysin D